MYDTELKQLIYLSYAQLAHQTREREVTLERALSTVEPIRSELRTISRQLRNFENVVWHSYYDLRQEKVQAGLLSTVKTWFHDFGRRPKHKRKKRQRKSNTETSNLPSDITAKDLNPDD